ncbi:DUF4238 domain-containing protein [Kribbella sp. NBC_00662]|uniref:DUF4238 domain-containing protein n=1 Tax=Kribbella sp. NBC_00662 TaxID=2975969 RepID=UPI0032534CCE
MRPRPSGHARGWRTPILQSESAAGITSSRGSFWSDFSNGNQVLAVRDRASGVETIRHIKDMGFKDFYTSINIEGELDGRIEQILCLVEGETASLITRLLNPFIPFSLEEQDRLQLAQFIAFQLVRGPRQRREIELTIDWTMKSTHGHLWTSGELSEIVVTPHPNEHLRMMCGFAESLANLLYDRPVTMVTLDQSLLLISDEPAVAIGNGNYVEHAPECFVAAPTAEDLRRRRRKDRRKPKLQHAHVFPARPAPAAAPEIGFPVSPRAALIFGDRGSKLPDGHQALTGAEAEAFARDLNLCIIENAYEWVAANPDHPTFSKMKFPPVGPILSVCDGGSAMSKQLEQPPHPRRPERLPGVAWTFQNEKRPNLRITKEE